MYHWAEGPNLYTDYECEAILTVTYPDPLDNSSQITTRVLDGWNDPVMYGIQSPNSCLSEIMDEYSDGKTIIVMVDDKDTSKSYRHETLPKDSFQLPGFAAWD